MCWISAVSPQSCGWTELTSNGLGKSAAPVIRLRAKTFLVFTVLPLTRLPAICEVLQTHLPHPGPVMAFLNVHVGLHLSEGEGKGAVIDPSFSDHQLNAPHLVPSSDNYGYCKAREMIYLAASVARGAVKPLCVGFNVHNAVFQSTSNRANLELCCRTPIFAERGRSMFVSEVICFIGTGTKSIAFLTENPD